MPEIVVWSEKAKRTYNEILEYLENEWTEKEIHHFIFRTETVIEKIIANPFLLQQFKNNPLIRRAVLHETVILIFQISRDGKSIGLITFRGTRQKPYRFKPEE